MTVRMLPDGSDVREPWMRHGEKCPCPDCTQDFQKPIEDARWWVLYQAHCTGTTGGLKATFPMFAADAADAAIAEAKKRGASLDATSQEQQ